MLALFGTLLLYLAAEPNPASLRWSTLSPAGFPHNAALELACIFLLLGYGTLAGLVPLHGWLPEAAAGPAPNAIRVTALLVNAPLLVILRLHSLMPADLLLAVGLALVTVPFGALGATFTYTGASANPGYWYNITNWSPYGVPDVSDTIIIPGGSVGIPDGTYADVRLTGGTLQGTFTVGGTLLWTYGTLAGTVTVLSNAVVNLAFASAGTLTGC